MDCFFAFLLFIGVPVVIGIIRANIEDKGKKGEQSRRLQVLSDLNKEIESGLKVRYYKSSIETSEGEKLPCYKVSISGTCRVPHDNYPCKVHFALFDSTEEGKDNRYPVFCTMPNLADDKGFFKYEFEFDMPYRFTTYEDLHIISFPLEALIFPKKGKRRSEAYVAITDSDSDLCFKDGSSFKYLTRPQYGYLETEKRNIDINRLIARIAIAVSASDGYIDKRETAVIKSYFSEQFASLDDPEKIKSEVNKTLKKVHDQHKSQTLDSNSILEKSCTTLLKTGLSSDTHAAYELAARIIAADEEVQESEKSTLNTLARLLEIPPDLAKEIQDKHFAVSMFNKGSEEDILDMPPGLTKEQKVQFLNKEYQKWRARVNHQDTKVRAEAEIRIQTVTKMRHELEKELESV